MSLDTFSPREHTHGEIPPAHAIQAPRRETGYESPPPHAESNQSTSQLIIFCIDDYNALWKWSVEYPELFWSEVWDYTNIVSSVKGGHVIDKAEHMDAIPEWFKESRLNFAENLLWCRRSDKTAIVATGKRASRNGRDGC